MATEHVVIRRPEYVAGSKNKPEVGVFVQTHSKHRPLNLKKLKKGSNSVDEVDFWPNCC